MSHEAAEGGRPVADIDGGVRRHPVQSALSVVAITVGLIALVLGSIPPTHFFGAVAGVIGLPIALYSQMVSATTNERWLNVIGMVASFVGAGFALRHGGFGL